MAKQLNITRQATEADAMDVLKYINRYYSDEAYERRERKKAEKAKQLEEDFQECIKFVKRVKFI